MRKTSKEDEKTLADLNSAHRPSQAKTSASTSQLHKKKNIFFLFAIYIIKILVTELSWSVLENAVSLGGVYRPRSRFSHKYLLLG